MKKKGLVLFAVIVLLQLGGMYSLDRYLAPSAISTAAAPAKANAAAVQTQLKPPLDVQLYDASMRGDMLAYYDQHNQLVVKNKIGQMIALTSLPGVHFIQWMDNGMTVLYVRDIYGKNEVGVFRVADSSIVPLQDIQSSDVQIDQVFKSSYSQTIYTLYHEDGTPYVASYEAIFGWSAKSLAWYGIDLQDAWLDDKEGTLYLRDKKYKVWRFLNGKLYEGNTPLPGQQDQQTGGLQTKTQTSQNNNFKK